MSIYKVTIMMNHSLFGAAETYYTPNLSPTTAATQTEQMLQLRANCMYTDTKFVGVRASIVGGLRNSSVMLPVAGLFADSGVYINIPENGILPPAAAGGYEDQYRAAAQWQLVYNTSQRCIRYMTCLPKEVVGNEPVSWNPKGAGTWYANATVFWEFLSGYGWQIRRQLTGIGAPYATVLNIVQQTAAPSYLGLVVGPYTPPSAPGGAPLAPTPLPNFTLGAKVAVSHMRAAKGVRASTLNGVWYVGAVDTVTYAPLVVVYLRGSDGIDPAAQRFTDFTTLRLVQYAFSPILEATFLRTGIHKRGRPTMAPHGRRSVIASLGG